MDYTKDGGSLWEMAGTGRGTCKWKHGGNGLSGMDIREGDMVYDHDLAKTVQSVAGNDNGRWQLAFDNGRLTMGFWQ